MSNLKINPDKIKKLRKTLGLKQIEFASKMNVNVSTVIRWETGKCKPLKVFKEKINRLIDGANNE